MQFQSTRPVWGATQYNHPELHEHFISIHAPRVGRDKDANVVHTGSRISIHAPRVGRDYDLTKREIIDDISIHAPRVGRDLRGCSA